MPRLFIISGCNGSGKTTASYTVLPELLECSEFINSDEFAKGLSPSNPDGASIQAGRYMLIKMQSLFRKRADFGIESTLATRSLLKTVRSAQELGYSVTVLYLWLPSAEMALQRVKARVAAGGHDIQEDTVRRRYIAGLRNFFLEYRPVCDSWILADNSEPPFRLIAEGSSSRGTVIYEPGLFKMIEKTVYDQG